MTIRNPSVRCWLLTSWLAASGACYAANVTTHHYDNFRTGWNWQETTLTPALLKAGLFAKLSTVAVDEQVDAQPLVLSNQVVNGTVYSTVVYIATENNSVYAINATNGAVLVQRHLEPAAPTSQIFGGSCGNNSVVIGINSTPVIDVAQGTLYVVTATITGSNTVTYNLHALDVGTLQDKVAPLTINNAAGGFNRQRSALTLFNGGVLIPFTSFCDKLPSFGLITYANMNASPAQVAFQTSLFKLASIWMSGAGPAVSGNSIYFSTGNGQSPYPPAGPPLVNLPESLVGLQGSPAGLPLSLTFATLFANPDASSLDGNDQDFGSGGVLIIPAGAPSSIVDGTTPAQFVTAVGKDGNLYVNNMGLGPSYVQKLNVGGNCECIYSYFTGADGIGHVAMGIAQNVNLYDVSAGGLTLSKTYVPNAWPSTGAFTSVSSNQTVPGTAIVWVAGQNTLLSSTGVGLAAFDPSVPNLFNLYPSGSNIGSWPNAGNANANIIPVVANGHVFVASYKQVAIFGQPNVANDAGTFAEGHVPITGGFINGYAPAVDRGQTYNPPTLTGGRTVATFYDNTRTGHSQFTVSGFSSDPGQGWLSSVSENGVTKTGTTATYAYLAGTAYWNWFTLFGFPTSGTVTASVVHQY